VQVVLYDTPGMHGTQDFKTRSESMRVGAAWQHSMECASLGLIVDAYRFRPYTLVLFYAVRMCLSCGADSSCHFTIEQGL
jgi:GTPase Era involved in 16S rRNA processing